MLSLVILSALSSSTVNWLSHPVRGNETVLLSGSFASDTSTADAGMMVANPAAVGTATIGAAAASLPSFSLRSAVTGAALRVPASHADAHAASFVLPLLGEQPGVSGGAGTEESASEVYPDESEVYPAWELSLDGGGPGLWINTPEVSPLPTSGSVVRLPLVVVRLWSVVCLYVSVSLCVSVCLRVSPCVSVCLCVCLRASCPCLL